MGLLNQLVCPDESNAERVKIKAAHVKELWNEYKDTIPEKNKLINQLPYSFGQKRQILQRLKHMLRSELIDAHREESEEEDLVSSLKQLEHSKRIMRISKLVEGLRFAEVKQEYFYELLRHLYAVLKDEARQLKILQSCNLRKFRAHCEQMAYDLNFELNVVLKLDKEPDLIKVFIKFAKEEHNVHIMTLKERILMKDIKKNMNRIFLGEVQEGKLYDLARRVLNAIEYKTGNAIGNEILLGYHNTVDYEFVNGPEFEILVRRIMKLINMRGSKEQILVFIRIFREWYLHERE
ncbi:hypothetical protein JXA85_02275 [Candidatus Woesearchaeota archaeon]|nr:hypothetical protein [Candidatus Woesearchaeota archaeon]